MFSTYSFNKPYNYSATPAYYSWHGFIVVGGINMVKIAHLKFINMRYNYLSKEMKKQLQSLPMKIDIAETEEADEYDGELWYYPMITE